MKKFLNPFVFFSGGTTLCAGMVIMAAMVLTAGLSGQTFRGILSYGIGDYPYWRLALHLAGGWAIFSLLLYAAARAFSPSKVRFIDIAGNQALAKLPGLLMLVCCAFFMEQVMEEVNRIMGAQGQNMQITPSPSLLFIGIVGIVVIVWFFAWSWKGFSIAANMRGRRAIGIYIVCYIIAEALSGLLCQI